MERPKRGWFGSGLKSDAELPPVGPAFATMDDAARYAHTQIGSRRNIEYGGVILESLSDGYFYCTEPIAGKDNTFDYWDVLKVDSSGQYLHPQGYHCVADYHSHPDMFEAFAANNPEFTDRQSLALNSFFSDIDLGINILERGFFAASYLSGPDGALLKHVTSGEVAERRFGVWLKKRLKFGHADGVADNTPESLIRKVVTVSQLRVIVSSPWWGGSTGTVPEQWQPGVPFVSRTYELPACGAVHSGLGTTLAWLYQDRPQGPEMVFMLKHVDREDYVLTAPVAGDATSVSIQQLFPRTPDGKRVQHTHFNWVGVYQGHPPLAQTPSALEPWLHRNFFAPIELANLLHQGREARYMLGPERMLLFYRHLNDGALLRYQCLFSEAEAEIFRVEGDGRVVDNQIESALLAGTLRPRDFVLRVAAAGRLSVIQPGKIWDKAGPVDAQWQPHALIPKLALSPPFITPDDAARWAHDQIGAQRDQEFGGVILKHDNRYFATRPVSGEAASFNFLTILGMDDQSRFIAPHPYELYAIYHSHPAHSPEVARLYPNAAPDLLALLGSFYSDQDLKFSITFRDSVRVHYLSGAENVLLKYVSSGSEPEKALLAELDTPARLVPRLPVERAVWQPANAGDLRVVVASLMWGGVRGKVREGWTMRSPVSQSANAQEQPFYTPATGDAQVAVLIALSQLERASQAGCQGVVLKHLHASIYAATEPTAIGAPFKALFPVRSDGQPRLPRNFRIGGFYYATAPGADSALPTTEPWLYKYFVSPSLLVAAMNQANATHNQQIAKLGLKLFFRTPDDALLQWEIPEASAAAELFTVSSEGVVTDNGNEAALLDGSLTPRAFVHRVLRAGGMTVLQSGQFWTTQGLLHDSETLSPGLKVSTASATFLSADDAARHAHERIGARRDVAYGGYILRRDDQRFTFTEPVRILGDAFAGKLLQPQPNDALLVPPAGHVIHGRYSSQPPLPRDELERWRQRGWTLTDLEVSATMFSDVQIRSVIQAGLPAYLSGSRNNLIEYIPSGSDNEALVLANANRDPKTDNYHQRLERGVLKPQDIVTRLAGAGELRVLQRTPLWGPRIRVYDDWEPNFEYADTAPQTPSLGAVFPTADAAAINAHVRSHGRNLDAQGYTAYLLKHPQRDEYVVSELMAQASGSWLSDTSNGAAYLGAGEFVHNFVVIGLFYSQQWLPSGLSSAEAWLTEFFATPRLLQRAEKDARFMPRSDSSAVLPIYLSTLEGALLRYQPPATSLFMDGEEGSEVSVQGMKLRAGTLDVRRYVALMAQTGGLSVLYSSPCWDRRGAVSAAASGWKPYANFARRRLGPVFNEQDDAVRYARMRVQNGPGKRLFGGLVLKRPDGLFVATEPVAVPREDFDLTWIFPREVVSVGGFPAAHTVVARYRTSPERELPFTLDETQRDIYRNMLSTRVIGAALAGADATLRREYLLGTDGCIISYERGGSTLEKALQQDLQPLDPLREDRLENTIEERIRSGQLTPQVFVVRLSRAGTLRVVDASKVWGPPRTLMDFISNAARPRPIEIRTALAEPSFSPIFAQLEAAVRYAHERCTHAETLQFGYVFRSARKEQYMVTMPLVRESFWKYEQVFPGGVFPQGYLLKGIYLCAATESLTTSNDPHDRMFHSPSDIDNGLRFIRFMAKVDALYLSCPDGALLRYQDSRRPEDVDSRSYFSTLRQQLREGKLTVLDYVRDLAGHGNLDVLVEGLVWAGTRRIKPSWAPGGGEGFFDYPMGCGPLFSHPDDAARYVQRQLSARKGHNYVAAILASPDEASFISTLPLWPGLEGERLFRLFYAGRTGPVQPHSPPVGEPVAFPDYPDVFRVVGAQLIYNDRAPVDDATSREDALTGHFIQPSFLGFFIRILKAQTPRAANLYLAVRGGALLKYVPAFSTAEAQSTEVAADTNAIAFLNQLIGLGQLSVLDKDAYWNSEGLIRDAQSGVRDISQTDAPVTDEPLQVRDRDEL